MPEIRCTPPKEDMGIPKILTTFFFGESPKIKHFFGCKGKEYMGIAKNSIIFSTKMGIPNFLLSKIENSNFLKQFLEFPFF